MARPQKNKIEYFPHPVTHGKKMSYMEKKYGNDGYAVWFKILEELGNTDFHYLNLSDEIQIMFLSDRCLVSEERLLSIIKDLVKLKEFDVTLWNENTIIFSPKYIESIKDAYIKRTNECINEKTILLLLDGLGVRKLNKSNPKRSKSNSEGVVKPQTKLDKTKLDKTRQNKTKLDNVLLSEISISDVNNFCPKQLEYFEIARAFKSLFIKNLKEKNAPTANQEKAKYKNYVDPIRLMIENDGVTKDQFTKVFQFLGSKEGDFWKSNILSTKKLREKFEQLIIQSQTKSKRNEQRTNQEIAKEAFNSETAKQYRFS